MNEATAAENPTRATYPDDHTLVLEREFAATPEVVFRAFTDPKALAEWYGPQGMKSVIHELDLRPGGAYRLDMQGDDTYPLGGKYVEIAPPKRLSFTWRWLNEEQPEMEVETMVTVELSARGGGTLLKLTHTRFPTTSERGMHEQGWTSTFESLAAHLA